MKQNGKARDRRGNKICRKEKSATVAKSHPKVREKKRQRGE